MTESRENQMIGWVEGACDAADDPRSNSTACTSYHYHRDKVNCARLSAPLLPARDAAMA